MFRRFGWFIGLNNKSLPSKRLADAKLHPAKVKPAVIMDTVQEIAIYIHRFHNLDLFQQGWYQIKITMRWEDSQLGSPGTPARVVQYEAPDHASEEACGIWRIDDTDNSFSTPPFRIKYARQDVPLSIMVSFNLSTYQGPPTSAVILKFELMYAPISERRLQAPLDACSASVHEFRIPPKALLGLHSYCPIHFDTFHSVLVDTTVHISLLKSGSSRTPSREPRGSHANPIHSEGKAGFIQAAGPLASEDQIQVLKALLAARDILLEELQNLSRAIDRNIDLTDVSSELDDKELCDLRAELGIVDGQTSERGKPQNSVEKADSNATFSSGVLRSMPRDALLHSFHLLSNQVLYLWNTFLKFHRANKTHILDYLRDAWAVDRRAEWSIWMVYTKVEMPHHFLHSGADDASARVSHKRASSLWKLTDDPAQGAAMRAELHRRSIAQMKINNRSIQDMHIFGDPSRIPIVIVERVINAPRRTFSVNSYFSHLDVNDSSRLPNGVGIEAATNPTGAGVQHGGRVLKVVVFVHGFQGNHLDLRQVRNQWLLLDPKVEFLMSEANEDKTSGDFREMGQRLAQEVITFLKKKMDKISRSGSLKDIKLSFVGHSIGNVIIRTALTESIMEPYLRFLCTYLSISGPHLGYLYCPNSLFNSGLWIMKKWKGTQCIHQLTFTDDPELQNTFLYNLCKTTGGNIGHSISIFLSFFQQKTLENFRNIILLSSPQDGYVPYHSARIELCQASSSDNSRKGKTFLEMLNNCLDQIRAPSSEHRVFMRCDVNFDTASQGRNFNTLIGRAAHIEFLETDIFARFIMWSFPELFR